MGKSSIAWTSETWNPITGCTKVSPGCDHCYAETFAERFRGVPGHPYEQGFDLKLWPERLRLPFTWRRPRLVFVNSMSDLFHKGVPDEFIEQVFDAMGSASRHTFQVLTKRPERMRRFVRDYYHRPDHTHPNVWLGVSIENQDYAWRADMLRETPATVRFLSLEPLLGAIELSAFKAIDWVIVGGESGPGARRMDPEWVWTARASTQYWHSAFFFKQTGSILAKELGLKGKGEDFDALPEEFRVREWPAASFYRTLGKGFGP